MKGLIKKVWVLVALTAMIAPSYANEISYKAKETNLTHVTFEDVQVGSVLQIKDVNGLILYKEAIKENGKYSKGFDLTALPNGSYYFELNKAVEIIEIPFLVKEKVVIFDKDAKQIVFKPIVHMNDGKMYVSKLAFEEESMELNIYFENSEQVLHDTGIRKKGTTFGRIYDFAGSAKGVYTVIVKSNGREFINKVRI